MPMRRLADGTIVRSLSSASSKKTNFDSPNTSDSASAALDPVLRPTVLDPTTSLPSAKVRGYKKRKLGLVASAPVPKKATPLPSKSAGKSEDDPLGLNDPEFMPGGKFHRQKQKLTGSARRRDPKNSGAGQPGALARQGFRGAGGRKDGESASLQPHVCLFACLTYILTSTHSPFAPSQLCPHYRAGRLALPLDLPEASPDWTETWTYRSHAYSTLSLHMYHYRITQNYEGRSQIYALQDYRDSQTDHIGGKPRCGPFWRTSMDFECRMYPFTSPWSIKLARMDSTS